MGEGAVTAPLRKNKLDVLLGRSRQESSGWSRGSNMPLVQLRDERKTNVGFSVVDLVKDPVCWIFNKIHYVS